MHYEIRGLLEEHVEDIIRNSTIDTILNQQFHDLPQDVLIDIAFETAYSRIKGYHSCWCILNGVEAQNDAEEEIINMINNNKDMVAYLVDETLAKIEQNRKRSQNKRRYDL